MKKIFNLFIFCVSLLTLTACANKSNLSFANELVKNDKFLLLELHNKERDKTNFLKLDENLSTYAQEHANRMANKNSLYHSDMKDVIQIIKSSYVGENIAWGQETEEEVVRAWMNSYGHRKNILNKHYKKVGFGISKDKNGSIYWCAVFSN